jgi:fructokinase
VIDTPVVDTIGAGDSFTAAFLTWWMAGARALEDLADVAALAPAVEAGHQAAAVTVGWTGADPPHRSDLPPDWRPC